MTHRLTFLGTSTSVGIPVIGCDCRTCESLDPKDKRMRSSVIIESQEQTILVDAGPDLRQQSLRHGLTKVDHVLYTHAHLDHIAGFDELRAFCWRRDDLLPIYGNEGCIFELKRMFSWAFSEDNIYQGYVRPTAHVFKDPFYLGELLVTPIPVNHGKLETNGFKFSKKDGSSIVYICDVKEIPVSSYPLIGSPDTLIIDCLREEDHVSHMCLSESLAAIEKIQPNRALLTHISHEMNYLEIEKSLPENVSFSFDTQTILF